MPPYDQDDEDAPETFPAVSALREAVADADAELSGVLLSPAERDEAVAAHTRVRTDGFSSAELDQLHTLGYSDPEIAERDLELTVGQRARMANGVRDQLADHQRDVVGLVSALGEQRAAAA